MSYSAAKERERLDLRFVRGLCKKCNSPREDGAVFCDHHRQKSRRANIEAELKNRSGKCDRCGVSIEKSFRRLCDSCREHRSGIYRLRRATAAKSFFDGVRSWVTHPVGPPVAVITAYDDCYSVSAADMTEFVWDTTVDAEVIWDRCQDDWREQQIADGASRTFWTIWVEEQK